MTGTKSYTLVPSRNGVPHLLRVAVFGAQCGRGISAHDRCQNCTLREPRTAPVRSASVYGCCAEKTAKAMRCACMDLDARSQCEGQRPCRLHSRENLHVCYDALLLAPVAA